MRKAIIVGILLLVGIYWLIFHSTPFPLNHDQLGLYSHDIHRLIGVVFIVAAGVVMWKWNSKAK